MIEWTSEQLVLTRAFDGRLFVVERAASGYHLFQQVDFHLGRALSSSSVLYAAFSRLLHFHAYDPTNARRRLDEVAPRVFLSNRYGAMELAELERHGITHVFIAGDGWNLLPYHAATGRFTYEQVSLKDGDSALDGATLQAALPRALRFVVAALASGPRARVLVHCSQGVSRSAAIVVAYLAQEEQISVVESLRRVQAVRPSAQPNPAFMQALARWRPAESEATASEG